MGEVAYAAAAAVSSSSPPVKEERYVQVASRFFRVKPAGGVSRANHHYLDACFLRKRSISRDRDIFMYKGDAAFCGEECRQEQMCMDEALHAVARRHRVLQHHKPAAAEPVSAPREAAAAARIHRRPTIANLGAPRTPVPAS